MFAYCENNPIICIDKQGKFPWVIVGICAVGMIVGGVLGYFSDEDLGLPTEPPVVNKQVCTNKQDYALFKERLSRRHKENSSDGSDNQVKEEPAVNRWRNAIVGSLLGLTTSGLIVSFGGAGATVYVGSGNVIIDAFGLTGKQTFALGAIVYDLGAMIISAFLGHEMEMIEYDP